MFPVDIWNRHKPQWKKESVYIPPSEGGDVLLKTLRRQIREMEEAQQKTKGNSVAHPSREIRQKIEEARRTPL